MFDFCYSNIFPDISDNAIKSPVPVSSDKSPIHTNFRLPIQYLDDSKVHTLSPVVSNDLELSIPDSEKSVYDNLFLPKHDFAKSMIPEWRKQFTTDVNHLNDSKNILLNMAKYNQLSSPTSEYNVDCGSIMDIWKDIKCNESFLEKYNYLDWDMLKHFNESSTFLQSLSFVHVLSPLISLILPFFILIFPFLILKFRGIPVGLSEYIQVLKEIAKHHFIGKMLNVESLSWDKCVYLFITVALYFLQIYQNVILCQRFYRNMSLINDSLCKLKEYTNYSIHSMESFLEISRTSSTYNPFCKEVDRQCDRLRLLNAEICGVYPFECSVRKFNDAGYMLKCYYQLHRNPEYESCLRYSVGFEGYINNLQGIYENLLLGNVSFATFFEQKDPSGNKCEFREQYYPPLLDETPVKNTCGFKKNMIISSPNKSGKTTILKTTALNIIFSQQVGCGFYESAELTPYTHVHSYLNIPDTSGRDSLFQAESRRCKEILDIIIQETKVSLDEPSYNKGACDDVKVPEEKDGSYRHFCIFDELYSGTNPDEASKAGSAFLDYLSKFSNVNFILTTHYIKICNRFKKSDVIQNYKMEVNVLDNGSFHYTYKLKKGISKIKGAVRVLKDMGYPKEIIDGIEEL